MYKTSTIPVVLTETSSIKSIVLIISPAVHHSLFPNPTLTLILWLTINSKHLQSLLQIVGCTYSACFGLVIGFTGKKFFRIVLEMPDYISDT